MTRNLISNVLLCGGIICCFPALAQYSPKPGNWGKAIAPDGPGVGISQQNKEDDARHKAHLLELKERIKKENAKRGIVPLSERMKPAGSHPAPSPGTPRPLHK